MPSQTKNATIAGDCAAMTNDRRSEIHQQIGELVERGQALGQRLNALRGEMVVVESQMQQAQATVGQLAAQLAAKAGKAKAS